MNRELAEENAVVLARSALFKIKLFCSRIRFRSIRRKIKRRCRPAHRTSRAPRLVPFRRQPTHNAVEPGAKNPNAKQVCSSGSIASYRSQVSTMPDAKLWSLSLLPESYQRSMDAWAEARPWIDPTAFDLPSLFYKTLEQVSGARASIRRFALPGSYGTSWTAMVDAGTEPSFRMMCRWPLPGSTSVGAGCPGTNVYT